MDLKIIKKDKEKTIFTLNGINPAMANTIRRYIIEQVPTLAIEEIDMSRNDSALYDEMVALRLGLVPLTTDLKSYNKKEECKCKGAGCASCQLVFSFKGKGPGTVYSDAIETKDPKVKPAIPKLPIVKLLKDQEIKAEGIIVLNSGNVHTKFSPGLLTYRGYPSIKAGKNANIKKAVEECKGALVAKGSSAEIKDIVSWNEAYEEICEKNGLEIEYSDEEFIFTAEAWGQLSVKEMLLEAMKIFDEKLGEFNKLIKKLK
ncbi:DNA-directed RNA polymerase subunit D [Candidatus Woesearchaeota archaeon]|nr:DNA-directed RNA polymerase subunit D [Candidatus Woesearchaeota archaeon]